MTEEINGKDKPPIVVKQEQAPCGCLMQTFSNGLNSLDCCIGCALERAANYLSQAGKKIRNNQLQAAAMQEQALNQAVAEQLRREKGKS